MSSRFIYSRELRTLGQELDKRAIEVFELRCEGGAYSLTCGDPHPPYTDLISLNFTATQLETLEQLAALSRRPKFSQVNFDSMAERLRAIGRYVERLDGRLLAIATEYSNANGNTLKIEYETATGYYRSEDFVEIAISELTLRMYKEREHISGVQRSRFGRI